MSLGSIKYLFISLSLSLYIMIHAYLYSTVAGCSGELPGGTQSAMQWVPTNTKPSTQLYFSWNPSAQRDFCSERREGPGTLRWITLWIRMLIAQTPQAMFCILAPLLFVLFRCAWVTHIRALALCSPGSRSHANTSAGNNNTHKKITQQLVLANNISQGPFYFLCISSIVRWTLAFYLT